MTHRQVTLWIQKMNLMYKDMTLHELQGALSAWQMLQVEGVDTADCRIKVIRAEIKRRQDGV